MHAPIEPLAPAWRRGPQPSYRLQGCDRHLIGARHLYYAGNATLQPPDDPVLATLRDGEWLGGGTFRNSFYLAPWAQLADTGPLHLIVEGEGLAAVRVACAVAGRAPETLAEARLDAAARTVVPIALPRPIDLPQGARLFWHVDALGPTRLHEVAFCTATPPPRAPRLAVLMRTYGREAQLMATLQAFVRTAAASPWHAALLDRIAFWLLAADGAPAPPAPAEALQGLHLRRYTAPNLGGGGNASHLLRLFLDHCEAGGEPAPDEVLILDDDLSISLESIARHLMLRTWRSTEFACSLPILMQSRPTVVWEDGGLWGRFDADGRPGLGGRRSLFPTLLKHGCTLDGYDRLDDFGPLQRIEYATFVFFALDRAALARLGLPAAFFLRGDDIEWSLRAARHGLPLYTNPNLAAWHEPAHSHAQEYMAILHAAIVNLAYSDNDAQDYLAFFEDRFHAHAALGDLDGLSIYLEVLRQLIDADSAVLTPHFAPHYLEAIRRFSAIAVQKLPAAERTRLEERVRAAGGRVLPFLHAEPQRPPADGAPVLLVNDSRGEVHEIRPPPPAARLAAMRDYLALLQRFEREFEALRARWCERLAASGEPAFWAAVRDDCAAATRLTAVLRRAPSPVPTRAADVAVARAAATAADAGALPLRELRERIDAELKALARLRAEAEATALRRSRLARAWQRLRTGAAAAFGLPRRTDEKRRRPVLAALPQDFEPELYLQLNGDVARAGIDPAQHYLRYGHAEGRRYRRPGEPSLAPLAPERA